MGSLITSHAMAARLRGFEEGSSFGPSLRKRSAASPADNPDGCSVDNCSAAEMVEYLSSAILGKAMGDKDARCMTDPAISSALNRQSYFMSSAEVICTPSCAIF